MSAWIVIWKVLGSVALLALLLYWGVPLLQAMLIEVALTALQGAVWLIWHEVHSGPAGSSTPSAFAHGWKQKPPHRRVDWS